MEALSVSPLLIDSPFIEANTFPVSLDDIQFNHIIPVFIKDNHPLISQAQFIDGTREVIQSLYKQEVAGPYNRVSNPVKGRIPSAKNKRAEDLDEHEKKLFIM